MTTKLFFSHSLFYQPYECPKVFRRNHNFKSIEVKLMSFLIRLGLKKSMRKKIDMKITNKIFFLSSFFTSLMSVRKTFLLLFRGKKTQFQGLFASN